VSEKHEKIREKPWKAERDILDGAKVWNLGQISNLRVLGYWLRCHPFLSGRQDFTMWGLRNRSHSCVKFLQDKVGRNSFEKADFAFVALPILCLHVKR